jgi:hypothetical protein
LPTPRTLWTGDDDVYFFLHIHIILSLDTGLSHHFDTFRTYSSIDRFWNGEGTTAAAASPLVSDF